MNGVANGTPSIATSHSLTHSPEQVRKNTMRSINRIALTVTFCLLLAGLAQAKTYSITSTSAGPVKLGMSVAQVRKAVKPWKLSRTSDGEGVALIAVKNGNTLIMTLYAGEPDPDAKINENARIELIQVHAWNFVTSNGVHKGMLLKDAEKKYGKIKQIMLSEIESREFATFTKHPKGLDFQVGGPSTPVGVYAPGNNTSRRYRNGSFIVAIQVRRLH